MLNAFGWINLAFGSLAAVAGVLVFRGVFHRPLSSGRTIRFLAASLIASLAGLMPLGRQVTPVQEICILSVYCSAGAIVAWRKFGLVGRSRRIFAVCVTAVLYFDVVFVSMGIFRKSPLLATPLLQPLSPFRVVQMLFAAAFILLAVLAVRKCRMGAASVAALGNFGHTH
jgi:hypothetical protein